MFTISLHMLLFSYRFLEIFVQGQGLDGEGQSCDRGDPPVPPPH